MDTCPQCGPWSVAGHNHKKVIELGPICASLHNMDLGPFGNGLAESSTKMAKHMITQTTPHDSPGLHVYDENNLNEIPMRSPLTGAPNAGEVKMP